MDPLGLLTALSTVLSKLHGAVAEGTLPRGGHSWVPPTPSHNTLLRLYLIPKPLQKLLPSLPASIVLHACQRDPTVSTMPAHIPPWLHIFAPPSYLVPVTFHSKLYERM